MCLKFSSLSLPNFPCCPDQTILGQGSIDSVKNLIRLVSSFILFSEIFNTVNEDTGYLFTIYKHLLNQDSALFCFVFPMDFLTVRVCTMNSDSQGGIFRLSDSFQPSRAMLFDL